MKTETKTETKQEKSLSKEPRITVYINLLDEQKTTPEQKRAILEMREIFFDAKVEAQ
jgi:hypothetical protein